MLIGRHSFIRQNKLSDVAGRIDYISNPKRQEHLYATYQTEGATPEFWKNLARENQLDFKASGTTGKCIEGREFIIALPESFVEYKADDVVRLFTDSFHKGYTLRLAPLEKEAQNLDAADASMEEILEDTEKNTQLVLKMRGESYPVRDCAIRTILSRAGVNGDGLRKLDKATYAKVVNYCLRVAKGDALIKIADGKVSAVHGGDKHDYCILDMKAMFETTCEYLNLNFKGSVYMEGSGIYDHSIVSAMWKLGGSQELLDTYRKALDAHGMDEKILSPALRFTTSDVAASGANLYPMLLTDGPNGVISLGSPIKLAHDKGATILDFRKNLEQVCARYVDAMKNLTQLMDIEIRNPVNCLKLLMKELGIKQKIRNEVVELFVSQNGEGACTAHDLYYAMNEASFFAACEGMSGQGILKLEEDITKALIKDWKKYDVYGAVKC